MTEDEKAQRLVSTWKSWLENEPLSALIPREKLVEAIRRAADPRTLDAEVLPRIERAFDTIHARWRASARTLESILGARIAGRIVEAAGDLEPDERAVRSFFEERAVGDLLGSVLYDGISEFMKKANQISEMLPGMSTAKKLAGGVGGFLGSLGGGLAGSIASGVREEVERKLEKEVRGFLAGFGKVAVERAARFATSPQNRKLFREMRMNLARKALRTPARELLAKTPPEEVAELRRRLTAAVRTLAEKERSERLLEREVERLEARYGNETPGALARRILGDVVPTEMAVRLLAPGLARFLEKHAASLELEWRDSNPPLALGGQP